MPRTQAKRSVRPQTTPPRSPSRAPVPRRGITLLFALVAEVASEAQRKTADHAPSLALPGSRPPSGDYPVVCASGCRAQAQRSVRPQTTPPRSPSRAPVPRRGITLLFALVAEVASEAQRKTADHAPSLALPGSRPPSGDYPVVCASGCRAQAQRSVRPHPRPLARPVGLPSPVGGLPCSWSSATH